jgi:arginine decarboxylase-like protein
VGVVVIVVIFVSQVKRERSHGPLQKRKNKNKRIIETTMERVEKHDAARLRESYVARSRR